MKNQIICSICKRSSNTVIITDHESGEIICQDCGAVIAENPIMEYQEWRALDIEEIINDRARTGTPTSLARHDTGLTTIIGRANRDATGHKLDTTTYNTFERLRSWDSRIMIDNAGDRNLIQAFHQLDILKDKLALSDVIIEKTAYIYRKTQIKGLVHRTTISGSLAAAVYIACREMGTPITLKDIAAVSNIKRKDIAKNYRMLVFELDIKIPIVDPMKCIAKIANKMGMSEKIKRHAIKTMAEVIKKEISAGKDPMGLAATVLYLSCLDSGASTTQTNIALSAGVTLMTIRNRFKDLKAKLNLK